MILDNFEPLFVQLEPFAGTNIAHCRQEARELADRLGFEVRFVFNDQEYRTYPKGK